MSLPSSDRVRAFARSDGFFTLADWRETFCDPVHVRLESEHVWPMEEPLAY
jgi:hypothetical protein